MKHLFLLLVALLPLRAHAEYFRGVEAYHKHDAAGAIRELEPLAQAGEADAQDMLGVVYDQSTDASGQTRARALFRQAAENGLLLGMLNLAKVLQNGRGGPADPAEAAIWLNRAAQDGLSPAMVGLGDAYRNGVGVPVDRGNAQSWYEKAANLNDPAGMAGLAELLLDSADPAAKATGRTWLERASGRGNAHAQRLFALGKLTGLGGIERDDSGGFTLARSAAAQGDALAAVMLGECYHEGMGVARSEVDSRHWYAEAARLGMVRGQVETARAKLAPGPDHDPSAAFFWAEVAAHLPGGVQTVIASIAEAASREITPQQQATLRQRAASWQPGTRY